MSQVPNLNQVKKTYVAFLLKNLDTISSVESWMKTLSYLIAGRISTTHSAAIAELFYASSSLISLFHDHILRKHRNLYSIKDQSTQWLKSVLAAIECVEVFVEIASRRYGSPVLKWILVFSVELIKTVGRFILLHKYRSRLRSFPIIRKLDRKSIESDSSDDGDDAPAAAAQSESFYTLNHSGRKVKSIANKYRDHHQESSSHVNESLLETPLSNKQLLAESLHNLQPLVYLFSSALFGEKSWIPWLASLTTDISRYTVGEERELLRRKFVLLMYLMRSPCYDKYTKMKIIRSLGIMARIPGAKFITDACIAYLPEWQSTYFYTWSS